MRSTLSISIVIHVLVIALSIFGLPFLYKSPAKQKKPMVVEVVSIGNKTELPKPAKKDTSKQVKEKKENIIKKKVKKLPQPSIKPIPQNKRTETVSLRKKTKKKTPKVKQKKLKSKTDFTKLARVTPRRKPKPPDPFESVLRNLAQDFDKQTVKKVDKTPKEEKKSKKSDFEAKIAKILANNSTTVSETDKVTMTEMDAMINTIRTSIRPCWNLQPGAKGAEDIVVVVRAYLTPDGRVKRAWVANRDLLVNDPFKLAAAETAQRAILNEACQPFRLDPRKYAIWRDVTLNFNPSEMFGK